MLSGKFQTLRPDQIIVDREVRQRRALDNLDELAESIRRVGQLHPIVINQEMKLVAGERRLTAIRDILGWDSIQIQWAEDLPEATLYLIELEENIRRDDLDWKDQCAAVANYHRMQMQMAEDEARSWASSDTARALNISEPAIGRFLFVQEAIEAGDPLVLAAEKYSTAVGIVERKRSRAKDSALSAIDSMFETPEEPLDADEYLARSDEDIPPEQSTILPAPSSNHPFLLGDFNDWAVSYRGPKFNFLHCDFPYGISADRHNQGASGSFGGYEDSADVYWTLLRTLKSAMPTVVADSAHMMFWFSMDYYTETKHALEEMGWRINPFPLMWHKSDNSGILPDPKRGPRRIYETCFLCSRGDRLIVQPVSNVFSAPNKKEIHMSEKNPEMLAHFFRMFVDEHTSLLDPTMGSGNAVVVAQAMGARTVLGLERSEEFFNNAVAAYEKRT